MNKWVLLKKQFLISTAHGIYIDNCALTGYLITSLSLKFLLLPSVQKVSWPYIVSSTVITFTILNPRRLASISRTKFRLLSAVTALSVSSEHTTASHVQLYIYKIFCFLQRSNTKRVIIWYNVVKQVTYTNGEQETNHLPVCNIPAVTHYIDRWVLIFRAESNKASFLANGYFLRVSPTLCRILSNSINIHKPSQMFQLLKIGMFCSSKTDTRFIF